MKNLIFSRKQILRAIQAAITAAFLTAGLARAQFKYDSQAPANQVAVTSAAGTTNRITGRGTFSGYFYDAGAGTDNVTVDAGASISSGATIIKFANGGSVNNLGTLTQSAMTNNVTLVPINVATTTTALSVSNSGSIVTPSTNSYYDYAVGVGANASGAGPVTITNATHGKLNITGEFEADAVSASSVGGLVTIENDGSISANGVFGAPKAITASNAGGDITVTNTNSITASGYDATGISTVITGAGTTALNNSATVSTSTSSVYGTAIGFTASSGTGDISLTNSSTVTTSGYATQGLAINSGGAFTLNNTGTITGGGRNSGGEVGGGLGEGVDVTAAGNISITSSKAITCSASGYYGDTYGVDINSTSGSVYLNNTGSISGTNNTYAYGISEGVLAQSSGAAITILNSSTISSKSEAGPNYGVGIQTSGTTGSGAIGSLNNTGTIQVNGGFDNVDGVSFNSSILTANIVNGATGIIRAAGLRGSGTVAIQVSNTTGKDAITSSGTITSNGAGIEDLGTGNITVALLGGSLSSAPGYDAIQLGTGSNTVNISNPATVTGLIDGGKTQTGNILRFIDITATAQQKAQFQAVAAQAAANPGGTYSVTLGSATYQFTDFKIVTARAQ